MRVVLSNRDVSNGLVLVQAFLKRGMPVPLSYAMGVTVRRLKEVTEEMVEERQRIVTAHQTLDSKGERVLDDDGNVVLSDPLKFSEEIETLLKQTNEVDVHQITLDRLEKLKGRDNKVIMPSPEEMEGLLLLKIVSDDDGAPADAGDESSEESN